MSILSFNHFDFSLMLKKVEEEKQQDRMLKSKFWRQCIYNLIMIVVYLGYVKSRKTKLEQAPKAKALFQQMSNIILDWQFGQLCW